MVKIKYIKLDFTYFLLTFLLWLLDNFKSPMELASLVRCMQSVGSQRVGHDLATKTRAECSVGAAACTGQALTEVCAERTFMFFLLDTLHIAGEGKQILGWQKVWVFP